MDTLLGSEDTSLEKISISCMESWGYNIGVEGLRSMNEALGSVLSIVNTHHTCMSHRNNPISQAVWGMSAAMPTDLPLVNRLLYLELFLSMIILKSVLLFIIRS